MQSWVFSLSVTEYFSERGKINIDAVSILGDTHPLSFIGIVR